MALDLHDVRCKLPTDLNAVLEAIADSSGRTKSDVIREYIEERLLKVLKHHQSIHSELKAVGMHVLIEGSQGVTGKK